MRGQGSKLLHHFRTVLQLTKLQFARAWRTAGWAEGAAVALEPGKFGRRGPLCDTEHGSSPRNVGAGGAVSRRPGARSRHLVSSWLVRGLLSGKGESPAAPGGGLHRAPLANTVSAEAKPGYSGEGTVGVGGGCDWRCRRGSLEEVGQLPPNPHSVSLFESLVSMCNNLSGLGSGFAFRRSTKLINILAAGTTPWL